MQDVIQSGFGCRNSAGLFCSQKYAKSVYIYPLQVLLPCNLTNMGVGDYFYTDTGYKEIPFKVLSTFLLMSSVYKMKKDISPCPFCSALAGEKINSYRIKSMDIFFISYPSRNNSTFLTGVQLCATLIFTYLISTQVRLDKIIFDII